jgi:exopolysaccharide biosynthesis polyprenyl glycosylphosphotransferase
VLRAAEQAKSQVESSEWIDDDAGGPGEGAHADLVSPGWPRRFWVSSSLSIALAVSLASSLLLNGSEFVAPAIVVGVCIAALACRLVMEILTPRGSSVFRFGAAAVGAASFAVAVTQALGLALGVHASLNGIAVSFGLCVSLLGAAPLLRSLELRLGASTRRVFFLGSQKQRFELAREVNRCGDMRMVGHLSRDAAASLASREKLVRLIEEAGPTTLVMTAEAIRDESLVATARALHLRGLRVRPLNDFYEQEFGKVPLSDLTESWFLFDIAEIHRSRVYGRAKRVVETGVGAVLLLLSAPLFPVISVLVKLSGPGPVFFRQMRIGRDGREFKLTKFRTMSPHVSSASQSWAGDDLARITRAGRIIRRYRLDEIPQLWHVLRGDLSLVGPRPEQPAIVAQLQQSIEFYTARHSVRPGITGWAQINYGYGGSTDGTIEKLQFDFFYIKRQSLRLDLAIIMATARTVLLGRGE